MAFWRAAWICLNAFIVGGVLMGFEMLSSRYLYPHFGGGIGTWAGLISTILLALAIGYFAGGAVVDRFPSPRVIAAAIAVSAIYLALIPAAADDVIHAILRGVGDGPAGIITASAALLLIPMSLLGMFSPVSLRLIIRSTDEAGRWADLRHLDARQRLRHARHDLRPHPDHRLARDHLFVRGDPRRIRGRHGAAARARGVAMRVRRLLLAFLSLCWLEPAALAASGPSDRWDGVRALGDVEKQLSFGVRSPGEPGHQPTIDWIVAELKKLGIEATLQSWDDTAPDGRNLRLTNIVGRYLPDLKDRALVGTHYDSIIRAYRDPKTPDAPMPGANNSASGVALLLETARALVAGGSPPRRGVDFVFFDGEEGPLSLGAGDPNWHALGSPYFVQRIRAFYPGEPPRWAAIFDMVCWRELKLYQETSSLAYAKPEVAKFWNIGWDVDPRVFKLGKTVGPISDDHTALGEAGIPAFLTIDFDYDPWFNTTQDTLDKCSADKLMVVGKTLVRFLYSE